LRAVGVDEPGAAAPSEPPLPLPTPAKVGRYDMPKPTGPAESAGAELKPGIVVGHAIEAGGGALSHLASIDAIAQAVAACTACPLHAGAKNPVPGEGNPHAGFVCVGEAPGATEDETGRPFVGAAGQLLTKILAAINLAREDVFICNVLKHRPPGNRNPTPDEIKACSPFLLRQLELLQPRVILALGTFAAQTLLQTTQPIGKLRGQVHRYYGVPLIVTYHPAALLRNPSWKRPTWEDVQLARRVFDSAASGA
jgi:DNA polymerase